MCCLPYRDVKDIAISDKLAKDEVDILMNMLKTDITSLKYLKNTGFEVIGDIETREGIMRKLCLLEV